MKKVLVILAIVLGITSISHAQTPKNYTITGVAIDSASREPVSYATVVLRQGVNNLKAVFTDEQGRFTISHNQAGTYSLHISFVGYQLFRKRLKLDDEAAADIGTIEMRNTMELDEVVVIGQLITSDVDKTSYNTAVDPETPSLTALEMMRKVPMLSVDGDDNLQLKGQSNFKILINGKASAMMSRNYKDVLRSMPASSIKRIEVITNPPAKYDAEGVAGIINIVTERKSNNSYYGQLFTMAETRGTLVGGGYLSASMGKFSMSGNLFGAILNMPSVESNYTRDDYVKDPLTGQIMETYRTQMLSSSEFNVKMYNASIDASYEIDTFNLLSISFLGNSSRNTINGLSTMESGRIGSSIDRKYLNTNNNTSDNGSISGSIDYQRSFMKPDRLFTLSYRLEHNPNSSNYSNDITGILNYDSYLKESDNQAWGREHTFQADYFEPLNKKNTLEVGTKYIMRPNYSNTDTYIDHTYDPLQKNGLDYTQHITSAYGSYQYKMDRITLKGGLRAEYTINTGTFHMERDESLYNKFFDLIPYATIGYAPKQGRNYRLGYSQRLSRPSIWHLNPYLDDKNPEAVKQGNPNLKSAISNVLDLSYSRLAGGGNYTVSASAYFTDNPIQEVSTITIEDGISKTFSTYDNIGNEQQYSLYFNGSKPYLNGKVRANINAGISYKTINGGSTDIKTQGWGGNASGGVNINSWKDANINAYGGIYFSDVTLQSQRKSNYFYLLGISQAFLNKKLRVSIMAQNIFNPTISDRSESWGENFNSVNETIYKASSVRLSLGWSFGKTLTQVKKAKRTIQNDDKLQGGESNGPKLN